MVTSRSHIALLNIGALCVSLLGPAQGQQAASGKDHVPPGWYVYPTDKLENLDESSKRCFNSSRSEWRLKGDGAGVKFEKRSRQDDAVVPTLPPLLKREDGMPGRTASDGLTAAIHYRGGWLLAYDAGEWGGGLWVTNADGSKTKRILDRNIRAVICFRTLTPLENQRCRFTN